MTKSAETDNALFAGIRRPTQDDLASEGPHRPIRAGEIVRLGDVAGVSGAHLVPEGIYGGRRTKLSAIIDRRQS